MVRPATSAKLSSVDLSSPLAGEYTLNELVRRGGVAASTVHVYRRLGLLPTPTAGPGHRFTYDERHLRSLRTIRRLRERSHLSLATIGQVLPALLGQRLDEVDDDEWDETVAAVVQRVEPARPPRRLLTAAREAFSQHGYDAASVEEITTAARLAKGSFYRYFPTKEDAFLAAARSIVDVINDGLEIRSGTVSPHEAIDELAELLAPMVPLFLEVVLRALHGQANHGAVVAEIIAGVGAGAARRGGIPADSVNEYAATIAEAALARWLRARF